MARKNSKRIRNEGGKGKFSGGGKPSGKRDKKAPGRGRDAESDDKGPEAREFDRPRGHAGASTASGGGFEFRDRSGKVHVIGGRKGGGHTSHGGEPKAPSSHAKGFHGGREKSFRPRGESEVVARPSSARGARPPKPQRSPREELSGKYRGGRDSGNGGGKSDLIRLKASVDKNRKGFGFLSFENREYEDAFVPPREAQSLFHGDRVEVTISPSGEVHQIRVLAHRFRELTGRYAPHPAGAARGGWIVYERKKAREEVFVPELKVAGNKIEGQKLEEGDWMRARLHFHDEGPHGVTAEILEVYGKDLPPSADVGMIANEYSLIEEHPEASEAEAREKRLEIPGKDLEGREDLRDVPFITIDGETARDFDDAVYVEREGDDFILWVAIADVSHYVIKDSALDQDAFSRATSVYFPERAFHMLPRALSENLCSLRPDEPRLTMVSRMRFDSQGRRQETEVMEAVIQSKRRATYNQIQAEWEAQGKNPGWEYAAHFALYRELRKQRSARGSIDFDLPEAELLVEKTGEVISIKNRARVDAHRLIEEFMIAANEAVTEWTMKRGWPFVYRVHDVPAMQALEKFQALAANVGVDFSIGDASPQVMAELVKRLAGHPAQELLNTALLRSMKQAVYSSTHAIHFGLASEGYTHFTSPIRRYPDLLVHRVLRKALRVEKGIDRPLSEKERQELEDHLTEACEHCSYRERLASDAEREANKLKQVRLMMKHLGDEFDGKVNGMTENGMFIQLVDPFVEGMIHRDTLDDDFYQFDDQHMIFFGKRKRRTFKMGDRVKVRVARADIDLRIVDFELLEGGNALKELPPGVGQTPPKKTFGKRGSDRTAGPVPDGQRKAGRFMDDQRPRKGKHDRKGRKRRK